MLVTRSSPPTVSVLLPTYKYARYLPQAIESILNQTYSDFELIISDDASEDGSIDILRSYAARDDRIRWHVQSPNLGIGHNWNWCLERASGKFIKYVFGDDYLLSRDALKRLVELIELSDDIAISASARIVVDEESHPIELWNHIGRPGVFDGSETINWSLRTNCNLIGEPSVVLFRKEFVARPFDVTFKQVLDWEFWIHLLQRGHLAYTDEPLCAFRIHPHQQTQVNRRAEGAGSEHPRLLRRYLEYFVSTPERAAESFERLYKARKKRIKHVDDRMFIEVLSEALGTSYYRYWIGYKLSRLPQNARRTWHKHVVRKPVLESQPFRVPLPLRDLADRGASNLR